MEPLPSGFAWCGDETPFSHQIKTVEESWERPSYAVLHEMGTGKTYTVIHCAQALRLADRIDRIIVIAPKGVYRNWVPELAKYLPQSMDYVVRSTKRKTPLYEHGRKSGRRLEILLVNTESFSSGQGERKATDFVEGGRCFMVLDESTDVKNAEAKRSAALARLARLASHCRIMTGSPITQNPLDLYGQLLILEDEPLGFRSYYTFRARYAELKTETFTHWVYDPKTRTKTQVKKKHKVVSSYRNIPELREKLKAISSRVLKSECLDLPDKMWSRRYVELTDEQRDAMADMKRRVAATLDETDTSRPLNVLVQLLRVHQIVCGIYVDEDGVEHKLKNNRIAELFKTIDESGAKKRITFAPYVPAIEDVAEQLCDRFGHRRVVTYYGKTSDDQRVEAVDRFMNDSDCTDFVGNPSVAGKGLTLTSAWLTMLYANSWKLDDRQQAEDRTHRIGQGESPLYVDFICPGTIDERIINSLRDKFDIASDVLGEGWRKWLDV